MKKLIAEIIQSQPNKPVIREIAVVLVHNNVAKLDGNIMIHSLIHEVVMTKQKRWIEVNIEDNYVIFEDNPKKKVPITHGKMSIDFKKKKLIIQFQVQLNY